MTPQEFAQKIKTKYPQYKDMDDVELSRRMVEKYPTYAKDVRFDTATAQSKQKKSLGQKALDIGTGVTNFLGGKQVAETFGAEIAKFRATPEERGFIDQPGVKDTAGSALQLGSLFSPTGAMASATSKGLSMLGLSAGKKLLGNVAAGAATGATFDVGSRLKGEEGFPTATAVGAAVPFVSPFAKGLGILGSEIFGVVTGAGAGAVQKLYKASQTGGQQAKVAREALRGAITPEVLIEDARGALDVMYRNRSQNYLNQLGNLKSMATQSLDVSPIHNELSKQLDNFNVRIGEEGLDFSQSAIRFDKAAQKDIEDIWLAMKSYGTQEGDRAITGVDSLKRAFADKFSESSSVRSFTKAMSDSAKKVAEKVPGYQKMTQDYAEQTALIKDIRDSFSLGNKAHAETAFKKLVAALRTNNEFRQTLVKELDEVAGNYISAQVAGQQMSEFLPRGLMRQLIIPSGIVSASVSGFGLIPLLVTALSVSPRIVGELVNALGVSTRHASEIMRALEQIGAKSGSVLQGGVD